MMKLACSLVVLSLLTSTAGRAQASLEVVLSATDDPLLLDGVDVVRPSVTFMNRAGDVHTSVTLVGPGVTSENDDALASWNHVTKAWTVHARKGDVIDEASDLRIVSARNPLDIDGDGNGLFTTLASTGLRSTFVTTPAGPPVIVSEGGVQCPGLDEGQLQQGDTTRGFLNSAGSLAFFDCAGFIAVGTADDLTYVPIPNPPEGATGIFQNVPTLVAIDDEGAAWLFGSAACDGCPNNAITGIWRATLDGAFVLEYDNNAHTDIDTVVTAGFPSINGAGDFAAFAFLGGPGVAFANSVIKHVDGEVTVIARIGDESVDRPGRPIESFTGGTGAYLTDAGDVIFVAAVNNPPGTGIFRSDGGVIETLAMTGDVVSELFEGSILESLSAQTLSVSRTGLVAAGGTMTRTEGVFVTLPVLLADYTGEGLAPVLYEGMTVPVLGGDPAFVVASFTAPLVTQFTGSLGQGTGADGFSDSQSDGGSVLALVSQLTDQGVVPAVLMKVGPPEKSIVGEQVTLSLQPDTEAAPALVTEQLTFGLNAFVGITGNTRLPGTVTFTVESGQVIAAEAVDGCVVDEDEFIAQLSSVTCTRDFVPESESSTGTQIFLPLFVSGPDPITITVVASIISDSETKVFTATTQGAPPPEEVQPPRDTEGCPLLASCGMTGESAPVFPFALLALFFVSPRRRARWRW